MSTTARVMWLAIVSAFAAALLAASPARASAHRDWPMFGWNVSHASAPSASMEIGAADLNSLQRVKVSIDGTVDSSAIYLAGVAVEHAPHDAFFVTTTYGKTLAINAKNGKVLWEFTPPAYEKFAGTSQITTATPVADPDRAAIYAASPDGFIRKLAVADGTVLWATSVTRLPAREKIASPLTFFNGHVIATTGGYVGDAPPYQGHVVVLDAARGKVLDVWNALCSDRHELLDPRTCPESGAAIWGRAGAVIDAATGDIFVATGNAHWDGVRYFGNAVVELDSDATKLLGNYTPRNTEYLNSRDLDLGSSSPVLGGEPYIIQGGKDGLLRVLDWREMRGTTPHRGGAFSRAATPGNATLFTAPAMWRHGGVTWIFVADGAGTAAFTFDHGVLHARWQNTHSGTSPVVADGMVFIYDPYGGLYVYDATSGRELAKLACGRGHWNSPIVVDGRIALPEGNANRHRTHGVFDIWSKG